MIVRLSDDAERDLLDGIAFYDQHGRDVGTHFFDSLMHDLRSLSVVGGAHAKRYGYHCMGSQRFPFAIYYMVEGNEILIVGILLEGSLPPGKMKLVLAWVEIHRDDLMADWELAVNGQQPFKIEPLR